MKTFRLYQPYWGAGTKFGWGKNTTDMVGFGVRESLLQGSNTLRINAGSVGTYEVNTMFAREVCDKFRSFHYIKNLKLYIIPRMICDKIYARKKNDTKDGASAELL